MANLGTHVRTIPDEQPLPRRLPAPLIAPPIRIPEQVPVGPGKRDARQAA